MLKNWAKEGDKDRCSALGGFSLFCLIYIALAHCFPLLTYSQHHLQSSPFSGHLNVLQTLPSLLGDSIWMPVQMFLTRFQPFLPPLPFVHPQARPTLACFLVIATAGGPGRQLLMEPFWTSAGQQRRWASQKVLHSDGDLVACIQLSCLLCSQRQLSSCVSGTAGHENSLSPQIKQTSNWYVALRTQQLLSARERTIL